MCLTRLLHPAPLESLCCWHRPLSQPVYMRSPPVMPAAMLMIRVSSRMPDRASVSTCCTYWGLTDTNSTSLFCATCSSSKRGPRPSGGMHQGAQGLIMSCGHCSHENSAQGAVEWPARTKKGARITTWHALHLAATPARWQRQSAPPGCCHRVWPPESGTALSVLQQGHCSRSERPAPRPCQ